VKTSWVWGAWAFALLAMDALAMGYLVVPGWWLAALTALILVSCLVGVVLQHAMKGTPRGVRAVAIVVVLGALTVVAAVRQAAAGDMVFGVLPTRASLTVTQESLGQAFALLLPAVPPVADVHVFAPVVMLAIGFLASIVTVAVLVWRASGVMVVATLVPWAAVFAMRPDVHWGMPALAVMWYLAFAFWRRRSVTGARFGFVSVTVAVVAVASSIVMGLAAPGLPTWGSGLAVLRGAPGGSGPVVMGDGVIGVATGFDVNQRLVSTDHSPILQVSGDYNGPLQVETVTDFDGIAWHPSGSVWPSVENDSTVGTYWPTGDDPLGPSYPTTAQTSISFVNWPRKTLPLGVGPRVVSFNSGNLTYQAAIDSLASNGSLDYTTVDETIGMVDRTSLVADYATVSPVDQTLAAQSLAVPQTSHTADLQTLVDSITNGINGDYDKLMAIQSYLTSSSFTYSTEPAQVSVSDDAVWDFLQRRTGYCVHFATAMVVMGRLAGIPMRAAIGFTLPASGTGVVTNQDAHMWPQAHFAGAGWVSFEPTPGAAGTAVRPSATPTTRPSSTQSTSSTPRPSRTPTTTAPSSAGPSAAPVNTVDGGAVWRWIVFGLAAAVVVGGAVAGLRRWLALRTTPERAWAVIVKTARARGLIDAAATPRAVKDAVGPHLGEDAQAGLAALVREIERERYEPPGPAAVPPGQWYRVQTDVTRDLSRRRFGSHSA